MMQILLFLGKKNNYIERNHGYSVTNAQNTEEKYKPNKKSKEDKFLGNWGKKKKSQFLQIQQYFGWEAEMYGFEEFFICFKEYFMNMGQHTCGSRD